MAQDLNTYWTKTKIQKKIDGHYLEMSNTGDYIYVKTNCNKNQYDMLMFEDMRKEVISWLVDFSYVTEVD